MAAMHIFIFLHFHSKGITTNLSVVSNNQEWRELTFMAISYWCLCIRKPGTKLRPFEPAHCVFDNRLEVVRRHVHALLAELAVVAMAEHVRQCAEAPVRLPVQVEHALDDESSGRREDHVHKPSAVRGDDHVGASEQMARRLDARHGLVAVDDRLESGRTGVSAYHGEDVGVVFEPTFRRALDEDNGVSGRFRLREAGPKSQREELCTEESCLSTPGAARHV